MQSFKLLLDTEWLFYSTGVVYMLSLSELKGEFVHNRLQTWVFAGSVFDLDFCFPSKLHTSIFLTIQNILGYKRYGWDISETWHELVMLAQLPSAVIA